MHACTECPACIACAHVACMHHMTIFCCYCKTQATCIPLRSIFYSWPLCAITSAMQRSWEKEVWNVIKPSYDLLAKKRPAGQTAQECTDYCKTIVADLSRTKESRNRVFNLALLNPNRCSVPNDVCCVAKAERSGRYHFWDQSKDQLLAPTVWPRGQNIPVAVLTPDTDSPSRRHYGNDSVICGFWWSYAQAIQLTR